MNLSLEKNLLYVHLVKFDNLDYHFNEQMYLKVVNAKNLKLKIIIFVGAAIPLNFVAMDKFAMI